MSKVVTPTIFKGSKPPPNAPKSTEIQLKGGRSTATTGTFVAARHLVAKSGNYTEEQAFFLVELCHCWNN